MQACHWRAFPFDINYSHSYTSRREAGGPRIPWWIPAVIWQAWFVFTYMCAGDDDDAEVVELTSFRGGALQTEYYYQVQLNQKLTWKWVFKNFVVVSVLFICGERRVGNDFFSFSLSFLKLFKYSCLHFPPTTPPTPPFPTSHPWSYPLKI